MRTSTAPARRRSPVTGVAAAVGVPGVAARHGRRGLLAPALVGAAGLAAVALVAAIDPEQPGHYPVCPTYALTGLYCPGCGGLRAVHALTRGDLGLALHRNPLVVLAAPVVVAAYLAWIRWRLLGRPPARTPPAALGWAVGLSILVWVVLRNVPALGWLAP